MSTTAPTRTSHPLDPLSAEEIVAAVAVVRAAYDPAARFRFVAITLVEPDKGELARWQDGDPFARLAEVVVLDPGTEGAYEGVVDCGSHEVVRWDRLPDGVQPAIAVEEYELCEHLVRDDPDFRAALLRRGIADDDLHLVTIDPVPPGNYGYPEERGRRLCRALAWIRPCPGGNSYARPIEGVVGLVDLHRGAVIRVDDNGVVPIPPGTGEFRTGHIGPMREDLKPLEIVQPEGPSFIIDGNLILWQKWSLRVGFTAREGLVLHTLAYDGRPIMHRASFCEMAVPYGDPSPNRYIQGPFDIGENNIGTLANALELGCDCLGEIRYMDACVVNSKGEPVRMRNAICIHEEDFGLLWKHWDFRTGDTEVRRSRRFVISFISTVGNYDYGFYWYLYQDGTIEAEVKATGIMSTAAVRPEEPVRNGTLVDIGLNAMIHQHFFSARIDLDIDGPENSVYEVETIETPPERNPFGNAFETARTTIRRESEGARDVNPLQSRTWYIVNESKRNAWGQPTAYRLIPGEVVRPFAAAGSPLTKRAAFTQHQVWFTAYDPRERFAAGDYPNQHEGGAGLPEYVAKDRSLENTDVVMWVTLGHHHVPRPEDWPIMPVARLGFVLKPHGFFDRNPSLDVQPPHLASAACGHHNGPAARHHGDPGPADGD
jgi:primary-amine oxidase